MKVLNKVLPFLTKNLMSLNQSVGLVCLYPLLLNFEVKKEHNVPDPEIQLAVWAAGAISKKKLHGWDTMFPMPGISVWGSVWKGYIFFEQEDEIVMMGPIELETTTDLPAIYDLFYRLHCLIKWGQTSLQIMKEERGAGLLSGHH